MEFKDLTIQEIRDGIVSRKFTALEVLEYFINRCKECKKLNAIVEIFTDSIQKAQEIDKKIARGENLGKLAGVPIAIKDNILYRGHKMGVASAFMQDFIAPYSATIVEKLLNEDAIIFARTNMDEFAMGGSTEKSFYGVCHNAIDFDYVAGGSSGGSAVAVAAGLTPCAIGTDTGGSIRQPSSFNGVVGIKPTYGTVSRYGIVAFASSLDQASPITKTVNECKYVLEIIAGKDPRDCTTIDIDFENNTKKVQKIGIIKEVLQKISETKGGTDFFKVLDKLKGKYEFVEVSIKHLNSALACYYIIAPAEATSNLARFDAIKYAKRSEKTKTLEETYVKSRSEGFGLEVKRRIMLGNYVLSSGYLDKYYGKAKKLQNLIKKEFSEALQQCDVILLPTTPYTAFKIGEKLKDPISMYLEDLFTVPANIAGVPAISVPYAIAENGLPLGIQFIANKGEDSLCLQIADEFQKIVEVK